MLDVVTRLSRITDHYQLKKHIENHSVEDDGVKVTISFTRTEKGQNPSYRGLYAVYNSKTNETLKFRTARDIAEHFTKEFGYSVYASNVKYAKTYPGVVCIGVKSDWYISGFTQ